MIISDRHRFAFVHIPKCAGMSLRTALSRYDDTAGRYDRRLDDHPAYGRLDYTHLPLDLLAEIEPDDYGRLVRYAAFAVVRDPMERFQSALNQRAKMYLGTELSRLETAELHAEIDRAIAYLAEEPRVPAPEHVHFTRQAAFIRHGGRQVVEHVFALERLGDLVAALERVIGAPLGEVGRINRTWVFRHPALREPVRIAGWLARSLLPTSTAERLRVAARATLLEPLDHRLLPAFGAQGVRDFVDGHYAEDKALHRTALYGRVAVK